MDRPDLELVLAVRRHGSLVTAARALKLAPSVVTKRLAALETRLGTRLFQRTTRRVSPTADGDTLCERAQELLRAFESAEAELRERQAEPSGPVRLAATFGFGRIWLGPALASFQALYPRVTVQVQLTEQLPDLAVEGLDGAIWLWNAPAQRAGEWVSRRLATNQRVLVASPAYLRRKGDPGSLDELASHDCLAVRENGGGAELRFDHWRLQRTGMQSWTHTPVRGPLSSNSGELVRDWCLAGHGIMLRSLWDVAPLLERGELVRVLGEWSMPDADIHWIAPYRAQVPRRIRLLVDFLAERFRDEPWRHAVTRPVSALAAPPGSRRKR
ncbi:LysR family transcriptional regulator [Hydrogenophaga pseudoflava]|uniref:LysR family transcriptional regulator n=1 Tax=Hydrogenophaga pseudoflava TaxID=47421 RepID=UPI0027E3CBB4|nr:LysR family transcriptional regulator [Hydrogenophaga pseudoflava]MDQ7744035.1 LysR family transcriptional regulator [Hydrogenophaga pseudoflava]